MGGKAAARSRIFNKARLKLMGPLRDRELRWLKDVTDAVSKSEKTNLMENLVSHRGFHF